MSFNKILLRTFESNIEDLEIEKAELTYYPGFDGEIVEKFVTCNRPNCICQKGYPHGPNKYFKHYENGTLKELYLGKKIVEEYIAKVESNRRIKEINKELRSLKKKVYILKKRLDIVGENGEAVQLSIDFTKHKNK